MFPSFPELPSELKLSILRKFQSIPYVRLRQTCRFLDIFSEEHRRHLGIYIYRKTPEIFLLSSLKETYPFYRRLGLEDADIEEPYFVVEYGHFYGEASLKIPMRQDNIEKIKEAISGFNFPEISVLNYCSIDDEEGNSSFSESFDYFMEIVKDLDVETVNVKNVTREQFDLITDCWDLSQVRLRKGQINVELINTDVVKKIRHFSCSFADNYASASINFVDLLKTKSIVTLDWGSHQNNFKWDNLEEIMEDERTTFPELFFYRFYLEEEPTFYGADLTAKEGNIIPLGSFYAGGFSPSGIPVAGLEASSNQDYKFNYFISELEPKRWRLISITRRAWTFCTDVCIVLETLTCQEDLDMSFISLIEEVILTGPVTDYSGIYERLLGLDTLEMKRKETVDYIDFIVSFYT